MILVIFLMYALLASTFTFGKAVLSFLDPFFFIALRMILAGGLLLGYLAVYQPSKLKFAKKDWFLFAQIVLFHVFLSYTCEFWALQYITSAKACLLFNLSPFITALYSYIFFNERLSYKQWIGLGVGFSGMLLVMTVWTPLEELFGSLSFFSIPELVLLCAVASGAYGWIVMRQLGERGYSYIMINGLGMIIGGGLAFITSLFLEGWPTFYMAFPQNQLTPILFTQFMSPSGASFATCVTYIGLLILIGNIIVYNLYGHLLKQYSPTFLSFAGFTTPLFAALFGWIFLGETVSWQFFGSTTLTILGLYLFTQKS